MLDIHSKTHLLHRGVPLSLHFFYSYRQINPCTDVNITSRCSSLTDSNLTYKDQKTGRPTCPVSALSGPTGSSSRTLFSSLKSCLGPAQKALEAFRESAWESRKPCRGWSPELCPLPLTRFPAFISPCYAASTTRTADVGGLRKKLLNVQTVLRVFKGPQWFTCPCAWLVCSWSSQPTHRPAASAGRTECKFTLED